MLAALVLRVIHASSKVAHNYCMNQKAPPRHCIIAQAWSTVGAVGPCLSAGNGLLLTNRKSFKSILRSTPAVQVDTSSPGSTEEFVHPLALASLGLGGTGGALSSTGTPRKQVKLVIQDAEDVSGTAIQDEEAVDAGGVAQVLCTACSVL